MQVRPCFPWIGHRNGRHDGRHRGHRHHDHHDDANRGERDAFRG